ncbi:MAG: tryptophan 7-halogenase [Zoogloeaceae bacterium]|nr:tryptophan 7-halogenase [Zoogloeaceae bacterium]
MQKKIGIAVLGGGPAGVATATGLVRLGYFVTLFAAPRHFAALESVSEHVAEGLRQLGLTEALATLSAPSPRRFFWHGQEDAHQEERLVYRPDFDAALLRDARRLGVRVEEAEVKSWQPDGRRLTVKVQLPHGGGVRSLHTDFVVEARGRTAPFPHHVTGRRRGAETMSLLQYWHPGAATGNEHPGSAVQSFADGWVWFARGANGRVYSQLTLDVEQTQLPSKAHLNKFCRGYLKRLEISREFIKGATPVDLPYPRASTSVLTYDMADEKSLRVGDAAVAGDPLPGNGILLALSTALQASAVIHTQLRFPERAVLAQEFHRQRLSDLFYRFARTGRDFYAKETHWPETAFWQTRHHWPDAEPLYPPTTPQTVDITYLPVLAGDEIIETEVVATPEHPLGIWQVDGVEVAPLLRLARSAKSEAGARHALSGLLNHSSQHAAQWLFWLQEQGWLADFE